MVNDPKAEAILNLHNGIRRVCRECGQDIHSHLDNVDDLARRIAEHLHRLHQEDARPHAREATNVGADTAQVTNPRP